MFYSIFYYSIPLLRCTTVVLLKEYFDEWTVCKSFMAIVVYVINICLDLMN